jgi:hypothetical protein
LRRRSRLTEVSANATGPRLLLQYATW